MEYLPSYIVHQSTREHYRCIPYPTFEELLARLDELHPNFGWTEKFSRPLLWLCGNLQPLDSITIDYLELLQPETLCVVFEFPPAWVWTFCEEVLRALERARELALQLHRESHCHKCSGLLKDYLFRAEF